MTEESMAHHVVRDLLTYIEQQSIWQEERELRKAEMGRWRRFWHLIGGCEWVYPTPRSNRTCVVCLKRDCGMYY